MIVSTFTGPTLFLFLLATCARADHVTWPECEQAIYNGARVVTTGHDSNATELNLFDCHIKETEHGAFDGYPNVNIIYLSDNEIEHIDVSIFVSKPNITELGLANNKFSEVPHFSGHSLPHLVHLDLYTNHITALNDPHTFSGMQQLQKLYMGENEIKYIHDDVFKPLINLQILHLNGNRLRFIPDKLFQMKPLETLKLNRNLIEYVQPGAIRGTKLKKLLLDHNRISWLPENIGGANRTYLKRLSLNDNCWHCTCLIELLMEVKRLRVHYSYKRYSFLGSHQGFFNAQCELGGSKPVCVFFGRQPCFRSVPSDLLQETALD